MTAVADVDGTVIAFDYGARRIGVAVGETAARTASPLAVVNASRDGTPDWTAIAALLAEWRPVLLVVGEPLNADGSASAFTRSAARFSRQLGERYAIPVTCVDEHLSSAEAGARLRDLRRNGLRRRRSSKGDIDALAAQVILETWMSARNL